MGVCPFFSFPTPSSLPAWCDGPCLQSQKNALRHSGETWWSLCSHTWHIYIAYTYVSLNFSQFIAVLLFRGCALEFKGTLCQHSCSHFSSAIAPLFSNTCTPTRAVSMAYPQVFLSGPSINFFWGGGAAKTNINFPWYFPWSWANDEGTRDGLTSLAGGRSMWSREITRIIVLWGPFLAETVECDHDPRWMPPILGPALFSNIAKVSHLLLLLSLMLLTTCATYFVKCATF